MQAVSAGGAAAAQAAAHALLSAAAAGVILFSAQAASASAPTIIRFPASPDPEIFAAQRTLVEAWHTLDDSYVDDQFGGHDWQQELLEALSAASQAPTGEEAYKKIIQMVDSLGDPYTRVVPAKDYADFRVSSDGEVQGVGLLIAQDPSSRKLMVLAPLKGSPAERAGLEPGDEVLSIDGNVVDTTWTGDRAAHFLRGSTGTSVRVALARRSPQVPGVAGRPEMPPKVRYMQVSLKRERLEMSPVFSTLFEHHQHTLGYIRLVNFGQHAATDMHAAIKRLQGEGAEAFILDLRSNPGGLVTAGLDVARLWLDGENVPVFNVAGRGGEADALAGKPTVMQRVVLGGGAAATRRPLAVLLNGSSASASEILAGAIKDNGRGKIFGDSHSYGKGKIQSVFELQDGSALFVTVARYKTPDLHEIDKVGVTPDMSCGLPGQERMVVITGVPLVPMAEEGINFALQHDSCVISAEEFLTSSAVTAGRS